jgi:hypothetical protein
VTTILGFLLTLLSILIIWRITKDALVERCALFSTRNFFLAGLLLFQSVSGAFSMFTGESERHAELNSPATTGLVFSLILTFFTILFFAVYSSSNFLERTAQRRSCARETSTSRLATTGIALTALGVVLRFVGESIPYVAVLLPQVAAGCLCGGVALVAMGWARSRFNPLVAALLLVAGIAASATLLVGAFGRREIIGLLFAVGWALYYEKWRFMPITRFLPRAVVATAVLAVVIILFSSARVGGERADRSLARQLERMVEVDPRAIQETIMASLTGQFAAGNSMWIYEARRDWGGFDPLHSLVYFVTHPVPRDWWAGKPVGLGLTIVDEAGVTGVSEEHSWGPGLVGHLVHDIVFISLPLYALILGMAFRYMDERMRFSSEDPVTVALFGCALGQVFGMARGDLGLFAFHMMSALGGVWLFGRMFAALTMRIDREATAELVEGVVDVDESPDFDPADHDVPSEVY